MVKKQLYNIAMSTNNVYSLADEFIDTLVDTNRGYSFFVDWEKVKRNAEKYNVEINILNSLIGSKSLKEDFREILIKYPEVTPVIPILIAVRDLKLKVIENFSTLHTDINLFDFTKKRKLTNDEIIELIDFCDKTGILNLFSNKYIKNLKDYILELKSA